jgi:cytochrome c biogenesis protein CcdA
MLRAIGGAGLFLILFYVKGVLIPFILVAALCGSLLRTRSVTPAH